MLLAGVLPLGGWLVVGPALATHGPIATEPPIDLDAPALAALRREAAASSVRAAGPTPSAAAIKASDDKARCGEDQAPVYRTAEPDADGTVQVGGPVADADGFLHFVPDEVKPAGVGYTGAMRRIDAALRSSGDPYDRAVADALNVDDLRSIRERLATLVQQAQASHDARIQALAFSACGSQASLADRMGQGPTPGQAICAALNVRQWAQDDPGNGIPWFYALQQADQSGDGAAQREALQNLASASRFVTRFGLPAAAVAGVRLATDADLAAQASLALQAIAFAPWPSYSPLTSRCRDKAGGDPQMAATCDAIANRMMEFTDSLMTRAVGGSIHKLATGDASRLDKIHREISDYGKRVSAQRDEAPCSGERQTLRHLVQVGERGEVALARESAH